MKKAILIQVLIFMGMAAMAQNSANGSILDNITSRIAYKMQSKHIVKNVSLNTFLANQPDSKNESTEKYIPTFSVDILDGSGIHLFTTPNFGPIPSMNIGARIHAGIKISI